MAIKMFVIHLGISDFPKGAAPVQRLRLTFKSLADAGLKPLIINKHSIHKGNYKRVQRFEHVPFLNLSYYPSRPDSFVKRNFNKATGYFNELFFLIRFGKRIKAAIIYTPSFFELVYYRILTKLLKIKMSIQYVEYRSSIEDRKKGLKGLNDRYFDRYCAFLCDSAIVISDYLKKHLKNHNSKLKLTKIPAICDFNEFVGNVNNNHIPYFMYCGTIDYYEIIEFVLQVFEQVKIAGKFDGNLLLIVSGNNNTKYDQLIARVGRSPAKEHIKIESHIAYSQLVNYYLNCYLLMIPLRNTVQDIARFPHKIGEYSASKRPIVTTNLGEPALYFEDMVSAILADEFTVDAYVAKIIQAIDLEVIDQIGFAGYKVGLANFNYGVYTKKLSDLLLN